ncbi:MAG: hypothetical protein R3C44_22815 [Chloroflexota bacterium]
MKPYVRNLLFLVTVLLIGVLAACGGQTAVDTAADQASEAASDVADQAADTADEAMDTAQEAVDEAMDTGAGLGMEAAAVATEFFSQEDLDNSIRLMSVTPEGPEGQPYLQALEPNFIDTTEYAKEGPYTLCFSNAAVDNPWRVVGFTTMQAQVDLFPDIEEFIVVDAEASDEKQISDIQDLVASGNCDALIVSPNTTAALTPVVEEACQSCPWLSSIGWCSDRLPG